MVADVRREVHGEADAHDQVDQGDPIQVDPPPGHVAQDPSLDAHDGEGHPQGADGVGNHYEADDHHEARGDKNRLDGLGHDLKILVNIDEVGMEYRNLELISIQFFIHSKT